MFINIRASCIRVVYFHEILHRDIYGKQLFTMVNRGLFIEREKNDDLVNHLFARSILLASLGKMKSSTKKEREREGNEGKEKRTETERLAIVR